jgi:hypothetical protein
VDLGQRFLVGGDPGRERLVLLADVDEVAHLGQQVRERAARQEGLEQRGPVAVVGAPDPFGQDRPALRQLGLLGRLPRLEVDELGVEPGQLVDQGVVLALDRVDLVADRVDLGLDAGDVGVDLAKAAGRLADIGRQPGLEPLQAGDLRLLGGDVLLEPGLAGPCLAELVALGGRGDAGCADRAEEEREEEEERSDPAAEATAPIPGVGAVGPAAHRRPDPTARLAHLLGDVIVRADSVGRTSPCGLVRRTAWPAGGSPSGVGTTSDDTGSWAFYSARPTTGRIGGTARPSGSAPPRALR